MSVSHLPVNLRLLCSYARSVSDVCRRIGVNRQQFNRYLNGKAKPSLRTIRKICDFFGFEDHELLMDADDFREIVRLRPPRLEAVPDPAQDFLNLLNPRIDGHIPDAEKYLGYYFTYYCPSRQPGTIFRHIIRIYQDGGALVSKQIERMSGDNVGLPPSLKHNGIVYGTGDRIVITERESRIGHCIYHTMLYATDYDRPTFLAGLTLSVTAEAAHQIICYRTIWEYLGTSPDLRNCLAMCGRWPVDDPGISAYVRKCTNNDTDDNDGAFLPKF